MGDRQLDKQRHGPVVGCELDVKPKPGERVTSVRMRVIIGRRLVGSFDVIFVANVGDGLLGVTNVPCAVVKVRSRSRRVGRDADTPALFEDQRRPEVGGVQGDFGGFLGVRRGWPGMGMAAEQTSKRRRMRRLGEALHDKAES